jgi:hypothetical protein
MCYSLTLPSTCTLKPINSFDSHIKVILHKTKNNNNNKCLGYRTGVEKKKVLVTISDLVPSFTWPVGHHVPSIDFWPMHP